MMGITRHTIPLAMRIVRRRNEMEKQAVIKPGVTPDLDPTTGLAEKAAGERSEQDEIARLERQDVTSRLADTSDQ